MPLLVLDTRNTVIINGEIDSQLGPILKAFYDAGWYIVTTNDLNDANQVAKKNAQALKNAGLDRFITADYPSGHDSLNKSAHELKSRIRMRCISTVTMNPL